MVRQFQQRNVKGKCLACNGSLNSYDSYSCPFCQGTGFVEAQTIGEALLAEAMAKVGGYEFRVERL
jgi:DnaJ-class molecular chaperone